MQPVPERPRGARHDRHARHRRAVADARRRPIDGYRTPDRGRFARLVTDATALLPDAVLVQLETLDLLVVDVPPATAPPRLARVVAAGDRPRLVLYRRPLEARATTKADLIALIADIVVATLAEHLGWNDDDLEDLGWDGPRA